MNNPQVVSRDLTEALTPKIGKTRVSVRQQTVQDMPHPLLTSHSQSVHVWSSYQYSLRSQCDCLEHV
jgi:hypothetical protein